MVSHKNIAVRAAAAMAALTIPATAHSEQALSQGEQTIYLHAFVPVYCNVDLAPSGIPDQNGVVELGRSTELCNAPRGYRVILETPPGLTNAALLSDNVRIPLSESGETVLVNSDHPNLQTRQLALDLGQQPGTIDRLGIRIEVNY